MLPTFWGKAKKSKTHSRKNRIFKENNQQERGYERIIAN